MTPIFHGRNLKNKKKRKKARFKVYNRSRIDRIFKKIVKN